MEPSFSEQHEFLSPLCNQWLQKISFARKARQPFMDVAKQCEAFYSGACGFMWETGFKNKHLGKGIAKPKFQITINKAFELVAIFGPYLFWQYPYRYVKSHDPLDLPPEIFQMVGMDPELAMQEIATEDVRANVRNSLMEKYLNYSQREQPGGLAVHAELAITEALVKGRGTLWAEAYTFPGSDRMLTKLEFDTVENLFVDPDAKDPMLKDAKWIARRHETASWELERMFGLPENTLYRRGQKESAESQAVNQGGDAEMHRVNGQSNDIIVWYEIWSKCGAGSRMTHIADSQFREMSQPLHEAFDRVVGDYAYVCVTPNVPWPLNAPSGLVRRSTDEEVRSLFSWRAPNYGPEFPCYRDDRWPVAILDFYRVAGSAWPIPPLGPALGELTCLNVLMGALVEQGYENRKSIIAYISSAAKTVKAALQGSDNPAFVELNEITQKNINEVIQFLNRPEMNKDLQAAIEYLFELFDKRTGLSEIMYAMNVGGAASRTARDVAVKEEKASIRPEKMSEDVARFMTSGAQLEKFLAGWVVEGRTLLPLLGKYGAFFWDEFIAAEDPEVFLREMVATVEASDVRKPNKERLAQNMQNLMQFLPPIYQQYAVDTGDTNSLNAFIDTLGESMEQDLSQWKLGPWRPEPDPMQQQAQQQEMQMEQAKMQAEITKAQLDAQKTQIEMEKTRIEAILQMQQGEQDIKAKQLEFQFDRVGHMQELGQDRERFMQEMEQDRQKFLQELLQKRAESRLKIQQMHTEGQVKAETSKQQAEIKTESAKEQAKIKAQQAKQQAKKKPSTNGSKA